MNTIVFHPESDPNAVRDAAAILHAGRDQWFLGTPGEYLASPYGKRFGGDLS